MQMKLSRKSESILSRPATTPTSVELHLQYLYHLLVRQFMIQQHMYDIGHRIRFYSSRIRSWFILATSVRYLYYMHNCVHRDSGHAIREKRSRFVPRRDQSSHASDVTGIRLRRTRKFCTGRAGMRHCFLVQRSLHLIGAWCLALHPYQAGDRLANGVTSYKY